MEYRIFKDENDYSIRKIDGYKIHQKIIMTNSFEELRNLIFQFVGAIGKPIAHTDDFK